VSAITVLERAGLLLELPQRLLDRRELRVGQLEEGALALQEGLAGRRFDALLPLRLPALDELQLLPLSRDDAASPEVDGGGADTEPKHQEQSSHRADER
jgi:hypothetical protein